MAAYSRAPIHRPTSAPTIRIYFGNATATTGFFDFQSVFSGYQWQSLLIFLALLIGIPMIMIFGYFKDIEDQKQEILKVEKKIRLKKLKQLRKLQREKEKDRLSQLALESVGNEFHNQAVKADDEVDEVEEEDEGEEEDDTDVLSETGDEETNQLTSILSQLQKTLPHYVDTKTILQKLWKEMKRHHRWLGVIYFFSTRFPRILRILSLATNILLMLFFQTVTYNASHGDKNQCIHMVTKEQCLSIRTAFGFGSSTCQWKDILTNLGEGYCEYQEVRAYLKINKISHHLLRSINTRSIHVAI
jgi:hypothetical protein